VVLGCVKLLYRNESRFISLRLGRWTPIDLCKTSTYISKWFKKNYTDKWLDKCRPGLRYLTTIKNTITAPNVIRAVGQLHRNMAVTDKAHPTRLSHLL
jgi:hypothetical protein